MTIWLLCAVAVAVVITATLLWAGLLDAMAGGNLAIVRDMVAPSMYEFEARFPTIEVHSWVDHEAGCIQYYSLDKANGQKRFSKMTLADWRVSSGNVRPLMQRIFDELSGART